MKFLMNRVPSEHFGDGERRSGQGHAANDIPDAGQEPGREDYAGRHQKVVSVLRALQKRA